MASVFVESEEFRIDRCRQQWRIGVMLAISTFGIWVTRLSAKIFISDLYLHTDADERVTMIRTYLALLRESSGHKC